MEQQEKIRDLDHLVEMLDRRGVNASGERYHFLKFESEIAEGEDIGLPIYDCPPSQDTKHQFHWHFPREFIPDGCVEYDHYSGGGKWMLFYPVSEIDEKWEMAKNLFDTGELRGVRGMKVSTIMYNPRTTYDGDAMGVLIMYCGPWTDEPLMREIGRNLALKTKYENKRGSMLYKTDDQTRGGTRATGQAVNHVYRMQVPMPNEGRACSAMLELRMSKDKRDYGQWHRKDGIEYDPSTSGKWMLSYPTSEIDDRWHLVKSLFDAGELHGVGELQVYTVQGNAGHPGSGVINVYCGPYNDEKLMMKIGKNLAKKMQYKNRNGFMLYKAEGQQMKQGRAMGQGWNHIYEISLPWRY